MRQVTYHPYQIYHCPCVTVAFIKLYLTSEVVTCLSDSVDVHQQQQQQRCSGISCVDTVKILTLR